MTIGDLISRNRKSMNMTLDDVARAVGVSKATVSRWESGDIHKMKRDKIAALSATLGIDPLVFLEAPEILTSEEKQIIYSFRAADPGIRHSVRILLGINEKEKEKATQSAI